MKNSLKTGKQFLIPLMGITGAVKIFGFLREIYLAKLFGTSNVTDAYKIILQIPSIVLSFVGYGISTSLIPLYSEIKEEKNEVSALQFINNLMNIFLLFGLLFVIIVEIFPELFIYLFASGFKNDSRFEISIKLLRISIWSIIPSVILFIITPLLNIFKNFQFPVLSTIPMNLIIILSFFISKKFGIEFLSYGILLGIISQVIFLIPFVIKCGFKYKLKFIVEKKYFFKILKLIGPITLGVAVQQINSIVDKNMASNIEIGGISALDYSEKLISFVIGIVISSLMTIVFPKISEFYNKKNTEDLVKILKKSLILLSIFLIPATFGFMAYSKEIIRAVYQRGDFSSKDLISTSGALFYYSLYLLFLGFREISTRVFFSMQDSITPTVNSLLAVILNIFLNFILGRLMGLNGLALATSISIMFSALFLLIRLKTKIPSLEYNDLYFSFFKITLLTFTLIVFSKNLYNKIHFVNNDTLKLLFIIVFTITFYFLGIYKIKIKEIDYF